METFKPTRALLNPKFEGYKLDTISQEEHVTRFPLQYKPTQATVSGRSTFSFQEVQSRITHNHISVWSETGRAVYVDSQSRVILIDVDAKVSPSFRVLYELPAVIQSDDVDSPNYEYPSAAFLTSTMVFVSDGRGTMYVLQIKEMGPSESLGVFVLPGPLTETPFRIHSIHRTAPAVATVIISSRHYSDKPKTKLSPKERVKNNPTDFDIWAIKVELFSFRPQNVVRPMNILWHRRGQDVPIYTAFEETRNSFLLIGGTIYREAGHLPPPTSEPARDEIVPVPRMNEDYDSQGSEPPKPPPYSWTQTSDSVTVAFPLPSSTPKSKIKVLFSPRTVTVHIDLEPTSVPVPRYSAKSLWDSVSSSTCYWTWDREAEHSFGLLTLHLDKQHEGTKWSQVFASAGTSTTAESTDEDIEVLETLDPSELWQIRESLEKYTNALREGDDASGLGLGRGVPSLAEGEVDMEVDDAIGRTVYLTWVGGDGSTPGWWKDNEEVPVQLLSTPVPGSDDAKISLIVKNNVDGTVFFNDPTSDPEGPPCWTHTSTFSALAFVLASKQDTRFTYHVPSKAVFAFEGGVRDRGGNVYIYRAVPLSEKWAKQAIFKVDDGYGGSLLGIGRVEVPTVGTVLVCLTEGELILIKNPL